MRRLRVYSASPGYGFGGARGSPSCAAVTAAATWFETSLAAITCRTRCSHLGGVIDRSQAVVFLSVISLLTDGARLATPFKVR